MVNALSLAMDPVSVTMSEWSSLWKQHIYIYIWLQYSIILFILWAFVSGINGCYIEPFQHLLLHLSLGLFFPFSTWDSTSFVFDHQRQALEVVGAWCIHSAVTSLHVVFLIRRICIECFDTYYYKHVKYQS
jgi:hypothetical protein